MMIQKDKMRRNPPRYGLLKDDSVAPGYVRKYIRRLVSKQVLLSQSLTISKRISNIYFSSMLCHDMTVSGRICPIEKLFQLRRKALH